MTPLFVVGTGRSGTTVLARALCASPSLLFVDEPRFLTDILLPIARDQLSEEELERRLSTLSDGTGKEPMKFLRRLAEHHGTALGELGLRDVASATRDRIRAFQRCAPLLAPDERRREMGAVVAHVAAVVRRYLPPPRWLVKQPDLCLEIEEVARIFPDARFVHVVRDLGDVLSSRVERAFQPDFETALEVVLRRLESVVRFGGANPDRVLHVRFESFVACPAATLREILAFGDVREARALTGEVVRKEDAHIGRARGALAAHENAQITAAVARLNVAAGFPLFEATSVSSHDTAL